MNPNWKSKALDASNSLTEIPFSFPHVAEDTADFLAEAIESQASLQGDGPWTRLAESTLSNMFKRPTFLVNSCSSALEMAIMMAGVGPGDEVIVPDFTFTSTANAVALRGATPVFVDVSQNDLNLDPVSMSAAISKRTKAIMVVHYGGVPANLNAILDIARENNLLVIEDAAQGIGVEHDGLPLGSHSHLGCVSFHATKNIQSGEGGALVCSTEAFGKVAEMIREKGTDRSAFFRGEVDKYTWRSLGSSYLPSDLTAAYLFPQLRDVAEVNKQRLALWQFYASNLGKWADRLGIRIVAQESGLRGNGHIFALVFPDLKSRESFRAHMSSQGINVSPHYVPLHATPAGVRFGKVRGKLDSSMEAGNGLVRLPMHHLAEMNKSLIVESALEFKF